MADKYIFPFEKLEIWQISVELAELVLSLLENIPPNRHIRLTSQMEAAVASPAQNIAEGKGRQHKKEFIQFLNIARRSTFENANIVILLERRGLLSQDVVESILDDLDKLCRQITSF